MSAKEEESGVELTETNAIIKISRVESERKMELNEVKKIKKKAKLH